MLSKVTPTSPTILTTSLSNLSTTTNLKNGKRCNCRMPRTLTPLFSLLTIDRSQISWRGSALNISGDIALPDVDHMVKNGLDFTYY